MSGPFQPKAPKPNLRLLYKEQLIQKREDYEQELNYLARCIDSLRHGGKLESMYIQMDVYYATQRRLDEVNYLLGL